MKEHEQGTDLAEMGVLAALLDDDGETSREVRGLLSNLRVLVVETPEDGRDDLSEVGLDPDAWRRPADKERG